MKLINLRTLNTYKVQQHLSGWIFRKTQINQQKVKQNLNYQFIVVYGASYVLCNVVNNWGSFGLIPANNESHSFCM